MEKHGFLASWSDASMEPCDYGEGALFHAVKGGGLFLSVALIRLLTPVGIKMGFVGHRRGSYLAITMQL
jgi:hypothetical protein